MGASSAAVIRQGLDHAGWNVTDLWVASVGIGGAFTRDQITDIAAGATHASAVEHDILAAALNDHFTGMGQDHPVQYWRDLPELH